MHFGLLLACQLAVKRRSPVTCNRKSEIGSILIRSNPAPLSHNYPPILMEESSAVGLEPSSTSEPVSSAIEDSSVTTTTEVTDAVLLSDEETTKPKKKKKWQDRFVEVDLDAPGGPSPIDNKKNIFSIFTYWWTGSILAKGYKRPLSVSYRKLTGLLQLDNRP